MTAAQPQAEQYFICAGKVIQNCALVDLCMASAVQAILGCSQKMAFAIFYNLDSLPPRQNLLRRIAVVAALKEDLDSVELINAAAGKANKVRQRFAHAALAFEAEDLASPMFALSLKSGRQEAATPEILAGALATCGKATQECMAVAVELSKRHGITFGTEINAGIPVQK